MSVGGLERIPVKKGPGDLSQGRHVNQEFDGAAKNVGPSWAWIKLSREQAAEATLPMGGREGIMLEHHLPSLTVPSLSLPPL